MDEPLLQKQDNRFTLFPIKYQDIYNLYKTSVKNFWTVEEVDLSSDRYDWDNKLNDDERYFIKNILAFFAGSDGIVNENLVLNFYKDIEIPEIRLLYGSQIFMEEIHSEMYALMIETYITDISEKNKLFNAINEVPIVKKKAEWALKWITKGTFLERLLAFIIVEGIFFSGSFCAIYWLKSRNLMSGLTTSNEFISRDESLHCKTGIMIYKKLIHKASVQEVHNLFKSAIELEKEFISESLPVSLIGMNCELMKNYIEFIGDYWLSQMDYPVIYKTSNPFPFMEYISLETKTDFFVEKVSSYQKAEITEFGLDYDF